MAQDRPGAFEGGQALGRGGLADAEDVGNLGRGHLPGGGEGLRDRVVGDVLGAGHGGSFLVEFTSVSKDLPRPRRGTSRPKTTLSPGLREANKASLNRRRLSKRKGQPLVL